MNTHPQSVEMRRDLLTNEAWSDVIMHKDHSASYVGYRPREEAIVKIFSGYSCFPLPSKTTRLDLERTLKRLLN